MSKNIKDYFVSCVNILKINIEEIEEEVYRMLIPKTYRIYFNNEETIEVTFDKEKSDRYIYMTEENFVLQRIANLFCNVKGGYIVTEGEEEEIYIWYKTTIKGNMIEENIDLYGYNFKTKKVKEVKNEEEIELINTSIKLNESVKHSKISEAEEQIIKLIETKTEKLIKEKKEEALEMIEREVKRINDYFELVKKEHQSSYTHTSYEDFGIINKEKDNLILQQKEKYAIDEENVTIKPIGFLYIKQK